MNPSIGGRSFSQAVKSAAAGLDEIGCVLASLAFFD